MTASTAPKPTEVPLISTDTSLIPNKDGDQQQQQASLEEDDEFEEFVMEGEDSRIENPFDYLQS